MAMDPIDHDTFATRNRARLSPSAATGLIGMRENVFIEEFFRTMGLLPFTTERWVRRASIFAHAGNQHYVAPAFSVL